MMKKNLFLRAILVVLLAFGASAASAAESLVIQRLLFADEIAGLGQYTPHPGMRFTLDDSCRVYVEVSGFAMPLTLNTQDEYNVNLAADVKVKLPQSGRRIAFQPDMATMNTKVRTKLPSHFLAFGFNFEGWTPGTYVMEVGIRDNIAGQTVSQDLTFELVEPTEADTKAREARESQQNEPQQETEEEEVPASN